MKQSLAVQSSGYKYNSTFYWSFISQTGWLGGIWFPEDSWHWLPCLLTV